MSAIIYALFEAVRTLAEAGESVDRDVVLKALRAAETVYRESLGGGGRGGLESSFQVLEDAFVGRVPTSAEESLVAYAAGELAEMEREAGVDVGRVAEAVISSLPEETGLRNLVLLFARAKSPGATTF